MKNLKDNHAETWWTRGREKPSRGAGRRMNTLNGYPAFFRTKVHSFPFSKPKLRNPTNKGSCLRTQTKKMAEMVYRLDNMLLSFLAPNLQRQGFKPFLLSRSVKLSVLSWDYCCQPAWAIPKTVVYSTCLALSV